MCNSRVESEPIDMANSELIKELLSAISIYAVMPNRDNWLVLRKHSRIKARKWLAHLCEYTDEEISSEIWEVIAGKPHVRFPGHEEISRSLARLRLDPLIDSMKLDSYLNAHPEALIGNAEADLCAKHSSWTQDPVRLRRTLSVLLDSKVDVVDRVQEVVEGEYRLSGFGVSTATTILECWNDGVEETSGPIYCKLTGHTEHGLGRFGYGIQKGRVGERYLYACGLQKGMQYEYSEFKDLSDVDLFLYFADPKGLDMGSRC